MIRVPPVRYDFADFVDVVAARLGCVPSDRHLAALCGVSPRQIARYRVEGLSAWMADRLAVRVAHCTPHGIWPRYSHDVEPEAAFA